MTDASKAIVLLASGVGAMVNVASASDFGTGFYASILKINDSICKVARQSEVISKPAMAAPAKSSDISALADQLTPVVKEVKQLAQTLASRKAINPLIPDSLINLSSKAVIDANQASALVAIALQTALATETQV